MDHRYKLIRKLVPELDDFFGVRIRLLELLRESGVLSRKDLAARLSLTEGQVRSHLDILREHELILVSQQGVSITELGKDLLDGLYSEIFQSSTPALTDLENQLKSKLEIDHCRVIVGDADLDDSVYNRMGKVVLDILSDYLPEGPNVIAVTGGSTLAKIAGTFTPQLSEGRELTFVPSRGGMGKEVNIQSNAVGSLMATQADGQYLPLFIPESVTEDTSKIFMDDPGTRRIVEMSQAANSLILSVGTAEVMAERRFLEPSQIQDIRDKNAVGEAFGVFYDVHGREIVKYPRIGLKIDDLSDIPLLLTVVGGSSKAQAVEGFFQLAPNHGWLICDEGVAQSILKGETL